MEDGVSLKKKKGKGKIVILLVVLLIIGAFVATVVFNVFNIRETYLRTTIDKIPVVKNLFPAPQTADEEDPYAVLTAEELQYKIRQLQKQIDANDETIKTLNTEISDLELENKRLKEIESYQLEVKAQKEEFDAMIAANDPAAYSTFYETISPENAERVYVTAKVAAEQQKEFKNYIATFNEMASDAAAAILDEMVQTDINLVVTILKNVDSEASGKILAEMDPTKAAIAVKRLAPETAQ